MPEYVYAGPDGQAYPHDKDAAGAPIGTVSHGDIRDLPAPLDQYWFEVPPKAARARTPRTTPDAPSGTDAGTVPGSEES